MSLTRSILTSSAQLTLANVLARALGVISLPLLTRWLLPDAYGQAALASTLISLISVICLMGMDMSYARCFLSRSMPNGAAVEVFCWRFAFAAAIVAGVAAALIWCIHVAQDRAALPEMAWWILIGTVGSLILAIAQTRTRLRGEHTRLAVAVASGGVFATVFTLCLARWWLPDERALLTGYVLAYLVPICIMGVPALGLLRHSSKLSLADRKAIFLVGAPGIFMAPIYWVLSSSDRWFLQMSTDQSAVGIYSVASTFGQLGMMVNSALLAVWLPEATRLHEAHDSEESSKVIGNLIVRFIALMMLVCICIATLGGDLLRLLSAEQFHSGAAVVPWLAGGVFFYGCYHLFNTGLFLGRSLRMSAMAWILVGLFSVCGNILFVPKYGMLAAARVQCAAFLMLAILVYLMAQRRHSLPFPRTRLAAIFVVGLVATVLGSGMHPITNMESAIYKLAAISAFSVLMLLLGVPEILQGKLTRERNW